jgi:hypothetical protein
LWKQGVQNPVFAAIGEGIIFLPAMNLDKHRSQAVISGNLNTLADGASVRPSARRPPVRSDLRIKGRPNKVQSDTHSGQGSLGKLSPP